MDSMLSEEEGNLNLTRWDQRGLVRGKRKVREGPEGGIRPAPRDGRKQTGTRAGHAGRSFGPSAVKF